MWKDVQWNDTWKSWRGPGEAQEPLLTWQCWSMVSINSSLYFYEPLLRAGRWVWMQRGAAVGCPSSFLIILGFRRAYLLLCVPVLALGMVCPEQDSEMQHSSVERCTGPQLLPGWVMGSCSKGWSPREDLAEKLFFKVLFIIFKKMCLLPLANVQTSLKCLWCQAASHPVLREMSFL